jgi:hypothetical protein
MKLPFYFSIDLEDQVYDVGRAIGNPDPEIREKALFRSYERFSYLADKYLNSRKITFFTTGVLARNCPELIKKIHQDGHEIACHYNFHDHINLSNRKDFARNLDEAIESIEHVIGEKPIGFRAPSFSIEPENIWAYEELAKRFLYDSSFRTSEPMKLKNRQFQFNGDKLYEFFIYENPVLLKSFKMKSGGTFFRLFSASYTLDTMKKSYELGHIPLIYMHPYELTLNKDFWISWHDYRYLSFFKRIYKWSRQTQWSHLGHYGVERKLEIICNSFEHKGPMKLLTEDRRYRP